jgi:hypothetical protein
MPATTKPKSRPISRAVREALEDGREPFFGIELAVERLGEEDLQAFAERLRKDAQDGSHRQLNLALAAIAEERLAIMAARRSPDGIWYASVEVIEWDIGRHTGQGIAEFSERCEGRAAAIQAARRLLVEHSHQLTHTVTVDARVMTELEWSEESHEPVAH